MLSLNLYIQVRHSGVGGGTGVVSPLSPKFFCQYVFFSNSPLNVPFLKEVTKMDMKINNLLKQVKTKHCTRY